MKPTDAGVRVLIQETTAHKRLAEALREAAKSGRLDGNTYRDLSGIVDEIGAHIEDTDAMLAGCVIAVWLLDQADRMVGECASHVLSKPEAEMDDTARIMADSEFFESMQLSEIRPVVNELVARLVAVSSPADMDLETIINKARGVQHSEDELEDLLRSPWAVSKGGEA